EYLCQANLNLYDSPAFERLSTQAVVGRQLRILALPDEATAVQDGTAEPTLEQEPGIKVRLCEDGYPGWLPLEELEVLTPAESSYEPQFLSPDTVQQRIPTAIQYAQRAMQQPNYYLWGGAVGPHYDCSGLVQAAFLAAGIWLPRDAYQQEAFVEAIALPEACPGDLLFFGRERTTHVGIYLGNGLYLHSSGKAIGRNGIGIDAICNPDSLDSSEAADGDIDPLNNTLDKVSRAYLAQFRSVGRVVGSYDPRAEAAGTAESDDAVLTASRQRFTGIVTAPAIAPTAEGTP
ncbi:MAG: C40 family peptidase, partial [Elainellaceae cyanobacterium]